MWWFTHVVYRNEDYRPLLLHMQCYIYTKCMYIWYHFIHNICWNVKNILYSNFMIIYRLCKVLSFTWSMTLSSTIWFWILKTFSQQLNDKLPTWKYISTFFSTENKDTVKHVEPLCTSTEEPGISYFFTMHRIYHSGAHEFILFYWLRVA
jgi:hypothetical protein